MGVFISEVTLYPCSKGRRMPQAESLDVIERERERERESERERERARERERERERETGSAMNECACRHRYRGTSHIRNSAPIGPYSRTMPRALWWPLWGGCFL